MSKALRKVGTIGNNYPLYVAGNFTVEATGQKIDYARINDEHVPAGLIWAADTRRALHLSGREMAVGADGRVYLRELNASNRYNFAVEVSA